ncbi:MAG: hypothetical protein GY705_15580, partial [Bacteroidetes bacterium]|nr:hypothetical protein [Bacteroidota bacterium]
CIGFTAPGPPGNEINPEVKLVTKKQVEELAVKELEASVEKNKSKASGKILNVSQKFQIWLATFAN